MTDGGLPPTAFFVLGVLLGVSSPPTDTIDFQRVSLPGGGLFHVELGRGECQAIALL
jgi:hypothetical protein